jgi:putative colanic acid biosynthesis acetyltransferase WcaF
MSSGTFNTQLKKFNNSWYAVGAGKFKVSFWFIINSIIFNSYIFPFNYLKLFLLRIFGAKIDTGVVIKPKVNIKYPWKLKIGEYTWIGENVWLDNLDEIEIGKNVCISQGALLICGNHNYKKETFDLIIGKIILEDGVWIGAKSVVCPGVYCYSHSVLTAGSIATHNLESFSIYQGNPAIKIKDRIKV